jgi:hypothetical protein
MISEIDIKKSLTNTLSYSLKADTNHSVDLIKNTWSVTRAISGESLSSANLPQLSVSRFSAITLAFSAEETQI